MGSEMPNFRKGHTHVGNHFKQESALCLICVQSLEAGSTRNNKCNNDTTKRLKPVSAPVDTPCDKQKHCLGLAEGGRFCLKDGRCLISQNMKGTPTTPLPYCSCSDKYVLGSSFNMYGITSVSSNSKYKWIRHVSSNSKYEWT